MKNLILFAICLTILACESGYDSCSGPQAETFLLDKQHVVYVKHIERGAACLQNADAVDQYYLTVAVSKEVFERYEPGEVIPSEELVIPDFDLYVPNGRERIWVE